MKKFFILVVLSFLVIPIFSAKAAETLAQRLKGYILLQVEERGEAWYVNPDDSKRYYMKDGVVAYEMLREFGLGIADADLAKIPVGIEERFEDTDTDKDGLADRLEEGLETNLNLADTDKDGVSDGQEVKSGNNPLGAGKMAVDTNLVGRLKGKILLQVQKAGQAWYINPKDGKRYYMKNGDAAYQIMRFLSLGITNSDLEKITKSDWSVPNISQSKSDHFFVKKITDNFFSPKIDSNNGIYYLSRGSENSSELRKFTLSADLIIAEKGLWNIYVDNKNNIWGYNSYDDTDDGLYFLDNTKLTKFTAGDYYLKWVKVASENDFLPSSSIYDIASNSEGLWIATDKGLVFYNYNTWKTFTYNDWKPDDYFKDNRIDQVEANDSYVVFRSVFDTYVYKDGKFIEISDMVDGMSDLYLDGNFLWQYTNNSYITKGVYRYNINTKEQKLFGNEEGLDNLKIDSVSKDSQGNLWFAANADKDEFGGLYKYDGSNFTKYFRDEGSTSFNFYDLLIDSNDNIYACGLGDLYKLEF